MRIPRRKGPRPKPSPFDPIITDMEVFHPPMSAANLIDKGVRTVNKLPLPFETFPGGHHYYKQSDLEAHLAQQEEERQRRLAAGRQNRREGAKRTHTTKATWVDEENGQLVDRALDQHPNEAVGRNLFRRLSKTPELLCPAWRNDRARLTYDVTDELGICPQGHRIDTIVPGEEFNTDTVLFVPNGGPRRRGLDVFEIEERRVEAQRQRDVAPGRSDGLSTSE